MNSQPIVITGFMAAGKTTVAQALARALDSEAVDLDQFITRQTERTPKEIIEQDGEPAFREIETAQLREVLERHAARVIALGGGAWSIAANRDLVTRHDGFTVWLDTPFEVCWQRIMESEGERPLAPDKERTKDLYELRRGRYSRTRLHVIASAGKSPDDLAAEIMAAADAS